MAEPLLLLSSPSWVDSAAGRARAWAPLPSYAVRLLAALDASRLPGRTPAPAAPGGGPGGAPPPPPGPGEGPPGLLDGLSGVLAGVAGHWALVARVGDSLVLAVDRMRSLGLLYAFEDGRWLVSDDADALIAALNRPRRDERQARIFPHFGYALGGASLIEGVRCAEAGSLVLLNPDGTSSARSFAGYRRPRALIADEEEFSASFEEALDASVSRLLDAAGDRPLVLPLSGGLDSRLLLAGLTRLGASNVRTFTYGKPGAPEVEVSRRVAHAFAVPWTAVDYSPEAVRAFWSGPVGEAFRRATWGGTSLPHVQDSYALHELTRSGWISPDALLLPGHTIVGNGHDEDLVLASPEAAEVGRLIAAHHACAQRDQRIIASEPLIAREIARAAREVGFDGSPASALSWVEWFNLRERQAKYINQSMRAYEFFDLTWAAPMLDLDMWRAWTAGGLEFTRDRSWYARFVARALARGGVEAPPLFSSSPRAPLPRRLKGALLSGMRATGAERLLARSRSIRVMLDHPMAFEAFSAPLPKSRQVLAHCRGASQVGLWSTLFLANRWGDEAVIVPPARG